MAREKRELRNEREKREASASGKIRHRGKRSKRDWRMKTGDRERIWKAVGSDW